jgi:hypothetical protein
VAVAHSFTLVTHNTRHFADIVGIVLEDWVPEYEDESSRARYFLPATLTAEESAASTLARYPPPHATAVEETGASM